MFRNPSADAHLSASFFPDVRLPPASIRGTTNLLVTEETFATLGVAEKQALLERLAITLERNARWAADEGDDGLETVMASVGKALSSVASDLAVNDPELAKDVVTRALALMTTFHALHPDYPVG